nr:MAG TPA: DNA binding protein [Caudoviricetes sp.]
MTKPEIIDAYAKKFEMTKVDAKIEIDHFAEFVVDMVALGETMRFPNFMEIGVKHCAARKARNPLTGEEVDVPETARPYVKCGKGLKVAAKKSV